MSLIIAGSVLALQLTVTAPPPRVPTVWAMGLDTSASQTANEVGLLSSFARRAVLPLVQPGDTLVMVLLVRPSTGKPPEPSTVELSRNTRTFVRQVREFEALLRTQPRAGRRDTTDIGRLYAYVRDGMHLDEQTGTRRTWVALGLSDGLPDGPQTVSLHADGTATAGPQVVFLGADPSASRRLAAVAETSGGFSRDTPALLVQRSLVDASIGSIRTFLGKSANRDLVRALNEP